MPPDQPHPRTHLFTMRVWFEPFGCDQGELRLRVTHVLSGETRSFRTWPDVLDFLLDKVKASDPAGRVEGGDQS
jgi:hypothetical protein